MSVLRTNGPLVVGVSRVSISGLYREDRGKIVGQVQQKTEKESIIESSQRQGEASDLKVLANIDHKY